MPLKKAYDINSLFSKAMLSLLHQKFFPMKALMLVQALKGPLRVFDISKVSNRHITVTNVQWKELEKAGLMIRTSRPRCAVVLELTEEGRFEAQQLLARYKWELEKQGPAVPHVPVVHNKWINVKGTKSYRKKHPSPSVLKKRLRKRDSKYVKPVEQQDQPEHDADELMDLATDEHADDVPHDDQDDSQDEEVDQSGDESTA